MIPDVALREEQGRASGYMMLMTGAGAVAGAGGGRPNTELGWISRCIRLSHSDAAGVWDGYSLEHQGTAADGRRLQAEPERVFQKFLPEHENCTVTSMWS